MIPALAFVSFAAAVIGSAGQSTLTINTPSNVVQCQPILLTWSGGTPNYFLSIHDGNNPTGAALQDLGELSTTSFTWIANITGGTSIGLEVRDSTGLTAQSAAVTIATSSDTSCFNGGATTSGGSASTTGSSTSAGTTTAGATTTTGATTTAGTTSTAGATTSKTSSAGSSSSSGSTSGSAAATTSSSAALTMTHVGLSPIFAALMALLV